MYIEEFLKKMIDMQKKSLELQISTLEAVQKVACNATGMSQKERLELATKIKQQQNNCEALLKEI